MRYVQYYYKDKVTNNFVEAMGDRSVVILDGRNSLKTNHYDAVTFNGVRRPVYQGYQLFQGASILRSSPITDIIEL